MYKSESLELGISCVNPLLLPTSVGWIFQLLWISPTLDIFVRNKALGKYATRRDLQLEFNNVEGKLKRNPIGL